MHRIAKWFLMAGLLAFLFSRTALCVVDLDLWHELALAREVMRLGHVPWQDHFAFTPKLDLVVHHEWGAGMIAYGLMNAFGSAGILVAKFVLIFGLASICWCVARQRGASVLAVGLVCGLAIVIGDYSFATIRAQMYSYLLTALLLWGFERDRAGDRRWLFGLWLLFPLWVNLHGGCLVGVGLLGAYWFEQFLRRQPHWHLFAAGLSLIPLALLNPWGWHYHEYLARAITMKRPSIPEWAPIWAEGELHHLLAFGVSVLLAWLVLREGRWKKFSGILLLVATGLAGIKSNRFLGFYAIVYACYLPGMLSRIDLGKDLRRWWWKYQKGIAAVSAIATVLLFGKALRSEPWRLRVPSHPHAGAGDHVVFPVGAVQHLADHQFKGNVFVPYDWGSYVMWKLGPDVQISFDSRYEVAYPNWRNDEDLAFYAAQEKFLVSFQKTVGNLAEFHVFVARPDGWKVVLSKYSIDIVLVPNRLKVATAMSSAESWRRIYRDAQFTMFARDGVDLPTIETDADPPDGVFP
jgi:hypothetical protein